MRALLSVFVVASAACGSDPASSTEVDAADVDGADGAADGLAGDVGETDGSLADVGETDATVDVADAVADGVVDAVDAVDAADATDATTPLDPFDRAPSALRATESAWVGGAPRTSVGGALWSAEPPENWLLSATSGPCRLYLGQNPFCADPCEGGLCTAPDACTAYPAALDGGSLAVSDGAATVDVRFDGAGYGVAQDGAVFAPGATLTFTASGGDVAAFTGAVAMPPRLVTADLGALALRGTDPLVLTWEPPGAGVGDTSIRIRLEADRGQHGRLPTAALECEVADTGSFTIPEDLRAAYVAKDLWGCGKCPASTITRYRRARVMVGARPIDLYAESEVPFLLVAR